MKITPSKEDYLKALLELSEYKPVIRCIDISKYLVVSRASVSRMMDILKNRGYISKEKYGDITLTENGRKTASLVKKKHDLLESFLIDVLGVKKEAAHADACRMEHVISFETAQKLMEHYNKFSANVKNDFYKEKEI